MGKYKVRGLSEVFESKADALSAIKDMHVGAAMSGHPNRYKNLKPKRLW